MPQSTDSRRSSERLRSAKRSRLGCPECRRRKIKCDEQKPKCGQCYRGNRTCRLQDSVFKRYSVSLQGSTPDEHIQVIQDEPRDVPRPNRPQTGTLIYDNQALGNGSFQSASQPSGFLNTNTNIISSINNGGIDRFLPNTITLNNAHDEASSLSPLSGPSAISNNETQNNLTNISPAADNPPIITGGDSETSPFNPLHDTQEELFLLRHYSECVAPWMDLLYRYEVFSREVLTLARKHLILRYAACAVAAKQLGQMKNPISSLLRGKTQERIGEKLANDQYGLLWYGAKYYEMAIQTLMKSITPRDSTQNNASPAVSLSQGNLMVRAEGEDPIVRLLGTCILIQYEQLSASGNAWSGHLTGFSKLIDLVDDGNLLIPNPTLEEVYPFTKDVMQVKASFWNFVVNDLEESFVSQRRTRIDTENISLWRNMGIILENDGSINTDTTPASLANAPEHARDKALAYTLIRLLCKLVDYIAPLSHWDSLLVQPDSSSFIHGKAAFLHLETQFDVWFRILSPSFHPDGTFLTERDEEETDTGLFRREIWFSNDLCSTTMMFYHMSRMLLLIHRPSDLLHGASSSRTGDSFDLLRAFRDIEQRLQFHASEVISIVRGTPCDAVKVRAIQPLYVAGRCCTSLRDRRLLVEMLTDIEDSLGITTGYRIQSLLQEWEILPEAIGMEA